MLKDEVNGVDSLYGAHSDSVIGRESRHVAAYSDSAVSWYERNATTGALTYGGMLKDGVNGVDGLWCVSVTLSSDGNHAYVAASSDDAVSWFERNATTGELTYGGILKDGVNGVDGLMVYSDSVIGRNRLCRG